MCDLVSSIGDPKENGDHKWMEILVHKNPSV